MVSQRTEDREVKWKTIRRMNPQGDSCVLVFVKFPVRGHVKTRLAAQIGQEQALRLYESFVLDILEWVKNLDVPVGICFDPPEAKEQFKQWLGGDYSYFAQIGRDLGQRMKNAFVHSFDEGFERVILIGSDIPDLPAQYLHEALNALESNGAVIGPSRDGGYYLIGFSRASFLPAVFEDITWSTSAVFRQTIAIFRKNELKVHLLPEWYDVDTAADLQSLLLRNRLTPFEDSRTYRYLAANGIWSQENV